MAEARTIVGAFFLLLGLVWIAKPEWFIKLKILSDKVMLDAKFIPGKKTKRYYQLMGIVWIAVGILFILLTQ